MSRNRLMPRTNLAKWLARLERLTSAFDTYKQFDERERGWIDTELTLLATAR